MERRAAEAAALGTGWLAAQPAPFQLALLRRSTLARFAARQPVFHAADAPGGIYGVVSASFGISVVARDAGPTLAHVIRAGVWFGHGPLFTRGPRTLSFVALEPAEALRVPLPALEEIVAADPSAALSLGALGNANVEVAVAAVADLLIRRADRRIASVLLRAAGAPAEIAPVPLSQSDLGEMANASRHLVNRTLSRFERAGWLSIGYARMEVRDPAALARFADGAD